MSTPPGYNELLQCPYEKAHRIQAHAMSKHLFKCRKNHPHQKFVSCPFNESHRVAAPELKIHTQQCEDRASFETYKYCISTASPNVSQGAKSPDLIYNNSQPKDPFKTYRDRTSDEEPEPEKTNSLLDDEECWDDMNVPAYNPQKYCEKAKVIRKATLKTPSEKKAFYESERLRLQDLKLNE
ncbi:gametocyte-specific factor 1 homolog [Ochlerotatus camptorhynchus]|uniref:gametocyte-specific factor 1 homolog n=1 Tax=Ochlerotatus camptorhynchus TaxID=644619 RepID=UPI0031D48725